MTKMLLGILATISCFVVKAQLLTWTPAFPVENNTAQTLTITVDAAKGNQGLLNYTPNSDVYVHIGVITNLSTSSGDWKYVKFTWGSTSAPAQCTYLGNNKWQYTLTGSLRSFFGITNSSETIQKIAILFRNGSGTQKQANSDGSDMYIPVYSGSLAVRIQQPPKEPRFVPVPEPQNLAIGSTFAVQADASKPSAMKLYDNGTVIATVASAQTISATATVSAAGPQQLIAEANDGTHHL